MRGLLSGSRDRPIKPDSSELDSLEARGGHQGRRHPGETRVLLVEDEPAMRDLCRVNLELSGISIVVAADGESALDAVALHSPDLILLDAMLPGRSGWDVARELGLDDANKEIPIVFMTARAEAADRARAYELGAVGYIVKPFDPTKLGEIVKTTLQKIEDGRREDLRAEVLQG